MINLCLILYAERLIRDTLWTHKVNGQPLTTARNTLILLVHPARLERATP